MVQVLDYFRRLYKQETQKGIEQPAGPANTLFVPTWEYVCWLEGRLEKYEQEPLPEATITTATSYCGAHDMRSALEESIRGEGPDYVIPENERVEEKPPTEFFSTRLRGDNNECI